MTTTRRLAAILAADVAGYSAAMERDEEGTAAAVRVLRREVIEPKLAEHQGRLIKTTGDGFLAEFASPIAALKCALAIQQRHAESGGLRLRIGLNLGDVIIEENGDVLGEGVNVAARLEGLAEPGGILISSKIYSEVEGKVEAAFEDRGEQQVKNISKPVRAYAVRTGAALRGRSPLALDAMPLALPDKPSIAVLPFTNMSGDPEQEYFADGIVEDIITALSRFKSLFVIARNSSFTYKGKAVDIKQVGRELGVRYVLEGSVRKSARRMRITGQLIEAASGAHLWADRFDGTIEDVFELQDKVTEQVVGALAPRLDRAELERSQLKRPESLDCYDIVLRARALIYLASRDGLREAVGLLHEAVNVAPTYSLAHALLAANYANLDMIGVIRAEEAESAMQHARLAMQLSGDDPEILLNVAFALSSFESVPRAAAMAERAAQLNPNLARAWSLNGFQRMFLAEHKRSIACFERALRLNPTDVRNPITLGGLATVHFLGGNYELAFACSEKGLLEAPTNMQCLRAMAITAVKIGDAERARSAAERLWTLYPSNMDRIRRLMQRSEDVQSINEALQLAGGRE